VIRDVDSIAAHAGFDNLRRELADAAATSQMRAHDYAVLGGYLLATAPALVFEIGTYLGATSEFILGLLPSARVVSIATTDAAYNTSHLTADQIGSLVTHRDRYTQLIGDSHDLTPGAFVDRHGRPDLVFIDGDHTSGGVRQDTHLALGVLAEGGAIFWHDAAHRRYPGVAEFLGAWHETVIREGNLALWSAT
jgi:predicted O-methyltransferase YrrM